MSTKQIRSRILEFFSKECLVELYEICMSKKIRDNNSKVDVIIACLNKYKIDFIELGPGTNRFAILIDGYVFKIALDKWGIQDNVNELTVSEELQPYVSKTYECNDLILVAEYVTVISREEFVKKRPEIEQVLAIISEGYLLGDVGIVPKNFCNWGYRDTGELVILDYAYIYRIIGDEMMCSVIRNTETGERCGHMLEYDNNFHSLYCPKCRAKYSFVDVRRNISAGHEKHENDLAKQMSYSVTQPVTLLSVKEEDNSSLNNTSNNEEESTMPRSKLYGYEEDYEDYNNDFESDEMSDEDYYLHALAIMRGESEDDILSDLTKDLPEEDRVIEAKTSEDTQLLLSQKCNDTLVIIEEKTKTQNFDEYTDEIENIREVKESRISIETDSMIHYEEKTEIIGEEGTVVIEKESTEYLDVEEETKEDIETITLDGSEEWSIGIDVASGTDSTSVVEIEVETPQQMSLNINDDIYTSTTETIPEILSDMDNNDEEESEDAIVDMSSLFIGNSDDDYDDVEEFDDELTTSMAEAFKELGVSIPDDVLVDKVTINETTSVEVEYHTNEDVDALRNALASDLEEGLDYDEYAEEFDISERIQKMKSTNKFY